MHVVVSGAGIVGASCALELVRDGHRVTILEPATPGGRQSASYGHGCWISPASVVPMSMPGLWRQVPGYLFDPQGPLVIRWGHLPRLAPWLFRFMMAGATVGRVERTAAALASILADSPGRHLALSSEVGCGELIRQDGLLYAYPDRRAFEAEALSWRLRRMTGLKWRELDRAGLEAREPGLSDVYRFGVLVEEGAHCRDPGRYVSAIVAHAVALGARLVPARATGFAFDGSRLAAVETDGGPIPCDRAVIASGIRSKALAVAAGDPVPLEAERGYHAVVEDGSAGPLHPVMPSDGRMANTPTADGLRLSGQVELASIDAPPNWRRADILVDHAKRTYPGLPGGAEAVRDRWMGHRPSTPDGLPVIGPASRSSDIIHAFGHGHVGFASGPITGRIVADLIAGASPVRDVAPFAASRFAFGRT
ncbi:D-amino-acid dehydrogenase (plasmid) [Azospirillum sp. B510]|uniref:NAD(P)/FAD-dependent oxidoreductase n=1 Tax=Azospirillum sp. (strain B510) TaxID=137722 RepID=UPI0001C4BC49|nr:FAD-binding oxidoreductase [Azospirillum sp. B510]BAI74494.1 D-amino-acid dehydrogenase [Azospirillum sp. B510]